MRSFFMTTKLLRGSFEQQLKTNQYYTIFVELKAFPYGKMVNQVNTYEEFADSDCELVL